MSLSPIPLCPVCRMMVTTGLVTVTESFTFKSQLAHNQLLRAPIAVCIFHILLYILLSVSCAHQCVKLLYVAVHPRLRLRNTAC